MGQTFKIIMLLCGLILFFFVINLLLKRRLSERNSLFWLLGAIGVIIVTLFPEIISNLSSIVGVQYPPSLPFFFSIMIIVFIVLAHSIQISELQQKNRELTQIIAILQLHEKDKQSKREGC